MKSKDRLGKGEGVTRLLRFLKGLICVPRCVSCGELLSCDRVDDGRNLLCDKCRARWEDKKLEKCPSCRMTYAECTCPTEILEEAGCGVLVSLLSYDPRKDRATDIAQRVIFRIKDSYDYELSDFLARELRYRIYPLVLEIGEDNLIVTFAPRTKRAKRAKGHDQSEILSKRLAHHLGTDYAALIKRESAGRREKKQKRLGRSERSENADRSFKASELIRLAEGKCVVLVDDIATTGSSLASCVKLLKDAGAISVMCVTVAKTVKGERIKKYG